MLGLIVQMAIFGLILWLILTYIPMPAPVKTVITVVAVILLVLWLLQFVGAVGPVFRFR